MNNPSNNADAVIVGGGPVGLYLGCCLLQMGLSFRILEKRQSRISHSRSLGIHPVSLELLEEIGCVKPFLDKGIKIRRGLAFSEHGRIGSISFESCPEPYNYILSLPQHQTEKILEEHLLSLDCGVLQRGAEVVSIRSGMEKHEVTYKDENGINNISSTYLIGCDGIESFVRQHAGFAFEGTSYPDTYIMGDFSDNTNFGSDAAIYLHPDGLVESFPLSDNMRRWVVKTDRYMAEVTRNRLQELVQLRTGFDISAQKNSMLSSFGVQKRIANPMASGRIALAGDAAHIVSPIGGQGMNLGWLDARELAGTLSKCMNTPDITDRHLMMKRYAQNRLRICLKVIRRAEWNMWLGRKSYAPALRNRLVRLMLMKPFSHITARLFTMRKLKEWPW